MPMSRKVSRREFQDIFGMATAMMVFCCSKIGDDRAAIVIMMNRLQGLDVSVSQARVFCSLVNAGEKSAANRMLAKFYKENRRQ